MQVSCMRDNYDVSGFEIAGRYNLFISHEIFSFIVLAKALVCSNFCLIMKLDGISVA